MQKNNGGKMSKLKHTPGPWHFREIDENDKTWNACEILDDNDEFIATHVCGIENARLLAAAPRMLRVLLLYFKITPTPVGKEIIEAATDLSIREILNER